MLELLPNFIVLTPELFVLGGFASLLLELLRALILDVEKYPRVKASWKFLPFVVGGLLVLLFPSAAPVDSLLMQLAHGAISPIFFAIAHPYYKKHFESKAVGQLGPAEKEEDPL